MSIPDSQAIGGRIKAAVSELNDLLGPTFTSEERLVVVRLTHDRGMRLRNLLLAQSVEQTEGSLRDQLHRSPRIEEGQHTYVLEFGDTRIEWPARAIRLGDGRYNFI